MGVFNYSTTDNRIANTSLFKRTTRGELASAAPSLITSWAKSKTVFGHFVSRDIIVNLLVATNIYINVSMFAIATNVWP